MRLIGSVGTRFHGWLGKCEDSPVLSHVGWLVDCLRIWRALLVHERTWLQGSIRLRLDSTEPWPWQGHGSGMMSMALAGVIMIGIHMIWVDSLHSDYENLFVGIYHEFSWILINFWSTFGSGQKCSWRLPKSIWSVGMVGWMTKYWREEFMQV